MGKGDACLSVAITFCILAFRMVSSIVGGQLKNVLCLFEGDGSCLPLGWEMGTKTSGCRGGLGVQLDQMLLM